MLMESLAKFLQCDYRVTPWMKVAKIDTRSLETVILLLVTEARTGKMLGAHHARVMPFRGRRKEGMRYYSETV